jgi:uncharacterized protein (DUF362 family)
MAAVAITRNDSIEQAITEALSHIELESLIRDKLVAVKPNETWASPTDKTGVTQPDTLRALLREVKRFGPRQLVVSGGAGAAETDEVFRITGLMEVVEQEGAEFFDHNRPPFIEVKLGYDPASEVEGPQKSVMVNPHINGRLRRVNSRFNDQRYGVCVGSETAQSTSAIARCSPRLGKARSLRNQ